MCRHRFLDANVLVLHVSDDGDSADGDSVIDNGDSVNDDGDSVDDNGDYVNDDGDSADDGDFVNDDGDPPMVPPVTRSSSTQAKSFPSWELAHVSSK